VPAAGSYYGGFSQRKSPWSSNEERLVDEALVCHTQPRELVAMTPPPLPQIDVWRPREGYGASWERVPTIGDVLATDRAYPDRRLDFSGSAGGYSGSSRPAIGPNPY
jgi:hypothetical protein